MPSSPDSRSHTPESDWVALVRTQVETLRFGVVQVVVHDGRVIQIERTEKLRLPNGGTETAREKISL